MWHARRIGCREGEAFSIERHLQPNLRQALARIQKQLRPSFSILSELDGQFRISGIVGTIDIGARTLVEVSPKTHPSDDWIRAVLDLLVGSDRVEVAHERRGGFSQNRRSLLEVVAGLYAGRLERAIYRDGPILLMSRRHSRSAVLKGKLEATAWTESILQQPHRFPISFNELSVDNHFSRALAYVSHVLSALSQSSVTRRRLESAARALRPGSPTHFADFDPTVIRQLPSQWAAYNPAWSIATAILANKSLLGSKGPQHGLSIVVEAWPLLETLLERSVVAAAMLGKAQGAISLEVSRRLALPILTNPSGEGASSRTVEPDARLILNGQTHASFEAKYKTRNQGSSWPDREDIYQALVAAAASGSPVAVLVYPQSFPPMRWRVEGMQQRPAQLVAMGLDLFNYQQGVGDAVRGRLILDTLDGTNSHGAVAPSILDFAG